MKKVWLAALTVAVSVALAGTSFAAEVKYKKKTLYKEGAAGGGSIAGVVSLKGKAPAPIMEDLKKGKNVEFCTKHPDTVKDGFRPRNKVTAAGGKLKDAVVFIEKIATGKPWGDLGKPILILKIVMLSRKFSRFESLPRPKARLMERKKKVAL